MTIKIWNSYSCNNSSSFRLVARFEDPDTAEAVAAELTQFFATHAKEMDAAMAEGDFPDESPPAAAALARRYGFTWSHVLGWGDDVQEGDEPSVSAEGNVLVVYHTYCSGFSDVPAYLRARGAALDPETHVAPTLSALFRVRRHRAPRQYPKANVVIADLARSDPRVSEGWRPALSVEALHARARRCDLQARGTATIALICGYVDVRRDQALALLLVQQQQ